MTLTSGGTGNTRRGPLSDLRIIEFAGMGPGTFAGMILADLGAEVIRLEKPGNTSIVDTPIEFDLLNRGKKSVSINLKEAGGREVALELVSKADLVIEGYRPGVMERLGLGPTECFSKNKKLIYGRMTGWGQDGPLSQRAGHDIAYIAITGALHGIGPADGPPEIPLNLVGDFGGGGTFLAIGLLAALREADKTGHGQVVESAIIDGVAVLMTVIHGMFAAGQWQDKRGVNIIDGGAPYYAIYETKDGRHMAVGSIEPVFYSALMTGLGLDADLARQNFQPDWPKLKDEIANAFAAQTMSYWIEKFEGTDACVAPVLSMIEAPAHPQIAHRETFTEIDGVTQAMPAPRFSNHAGLISQGLPPRVGQHTQEILANWGISDIAGLIEAGIVQLEN
jgi:alpha-methylacyl-CoA racemase